MRIVVKVGTSTLAYPTGRLNIQRMERLCKTLSDLKNAGHEIILVSSGAIAMGFGKLNLSERPKDMPGKQASAAVGQCELMYVYDKLFTEYNHIVGQLLITAPDIADGGSRKANFHNTMDRLLELGALPVINENDTVSTEEIAVGDNDTLSAIVAATVSADLLVLLSDIDGLYDGDPRKNPDAKLIPTVETVDERIIALGGGSGSSLGTGGMATKLLAAQIAVGAGCDHDLKRQSVHKLKNCPDPLIIHIVKCLIKHHQPDCLSADIIIVQLDKGCGYRHIERGLCLASALFLTNLRVKRIAAILMCDLNIIIHIGAVIRKFI